MLGIFVIHNNIFFVMIFYGNFLYRESQFGEYDIDRKVFFLKKKNNCCSR